MENDSVRVVDLGPKDQTHIDQIAQMLFLSFQKYSPAWLPDLEACHRQINASFETGRRSRVALDVNGKPVGWIGAIIDDDVWEIHPIVVSPARRRSGVGKLLVADIECLAVAAGAAAVWAGTSDETNATSFSGVDLYSEAAQAISNPQAPDDHPINFWLGIGYSIVGVMPDEEGLGKPGIHFSKRIV